MKVWLILAVFCTASLFGAESPLLERLRGAERGDYIVTETNRMISLIAVRSISASSIVFEEITAPKQALEPLPSSWSQWLLKGAPGHTSWSMIEIDLQTLQLDECYSFSRAAWIPLGTQDSLVTTLLHLPLKPVAEAERRRIGPPPLADETDRRKIWQPAFISDGRQIDGIEFNAYQAHWPEDGSELSGRAVTLYFDAAKRSPLPFLIQVDTSHLTVHLRAIDSGRRLPAKHANIPRRIPEFVGVPQKTEKGIRFTIKSPHYFRDFELFAVDVTGRKKEICPIIHSLATGEGDLLQIEIAESELQQVLVPEHHYKWLIVPTGHSEAYSESPKPFHWKK